MLVCCRWQAFWIDWSICTTSPSISTSKQHWTGIIWLFASPRWDARRRLPTCPNTSGRELISQRKKVIHIAMGGICSLLSNAAGPNLLLFHRHPVVGDCTEGPSCYHEEAPHNPVVCSPDDTTETCQEAGPPCWHGGHTHREVLLSIWRILF